MLDAWLRMTEDDNACKIINFYNERKLRMSRFSKTLTGFGVAMSLVAMPSFAIAKKSPTAAAHKKTSKTTAVGKKSSAPAAAGTASSGGSDMDANRAAMKKKSEESKRTGKM